MNISGLSENAHRRVSPREAPCGQIRRFNCSIRNPTFHCRIWGRCPTDRRGTDLYPSEASGRRPMDKGGYPAIWIYRSISKKWFYPIHKPLQALL